MTANGFKVVPGFALGSWVGFMSMNNSMHMNHSIGDQTMKMGNLVLLLDTEVLPLLHKLVEAGLKITAIHNHLINETPNVNYVHFFGSGNKVKLARQLNLCYR